MDPTEEMAYARRIAELSAKVASAEKQEGYAKGIVDFYKQRVERLQHSANILPLLRAFGDNGFFGGSLAFYYEGLENKVTYATPSLEKYLLHPAGADLSVRAIAFMPDLKSKLILPSEFTQRGIHENVVFQTFPYFLTYEDRTIATILELREKQHGVRKLIPRRVQLPFFQNLAAMLSQGIKPTDSPPQSQ